MVWNLKLPPPGPRPRRRVRELAEDLGASVEQVFAILNEIGEYVSSPLSFVEEPVMAKVYEHCGSSYSAPTGKPVPRWGNPTFDPESHIEPPKPDCRQTDPKQKLRRHTAADEASRWAVGLGQDASDAFAHESWKLYRFSQAERDVWIDSGLRPGQAKVAAALRDAGLRPSDLQTVVNGWTVLDRVTKGEGAQGVARLLRTVS